MYVSGRMPKGEYAYHKLTLEEAKNLVSRGNFVSAVRDNTTASVLSYLLEVNIPVNKEPVIDSKEEGLIFVPHGQVRGVKVSDIDFHFNLVFPLR